MTRIILRRGPWDARDGGHDTVVVDYFAMEVWRNGVSLRLGTSSKPPRSSFRMLAALLTACPRTVSRTDLFEACWGDDAEGGPLNPRNALSAMRTLLRYRLAGLGLAIEPDSPLQGAPWRIKMQPWPFGYQQAAA